MRIWNSSEGFPFTNGTNPPGIPSTRPSSSGLHPDSIQFRHCCARTTSARIATKHAKRKINLIYARFLLITLALAGCAHPYVGTYVKETLPDHHIQLEKNHTFSLVEAQKFEGTYRVKGQTVTLTSTTGKTTSGMISNNIFLDSHGGKWLKQTGPTP